MTLETFANNYITALSGNGGSITSGTTTINLASGTGAPSGQARFVIGTEIIIGSVSGTVLTATTRGAESSTAASHLDGAIVSHVLTVASLLADIQQNSASPQDNESVAAALINATSSGDAGNRSDHFPGSVLRGSWSSVGATPAAVAVGYSSLGVLVNSTAGDTIYQQAYTPSGAFDIHARVRVTGVNSAGSSIGVLIKDSTAGGETGNGMLITMELGTVPRAEFFSLDSGSFTSRGGGSGSGEFGYGWVYIRITRDGSNQWNAYRSNDRSLWIQVGSINYSKTFTVASMALRFAGSNAQTPPIWDANCDFIDVVS